MTKLRVGLISLLGVLLGGASLAWANPPERPNIIFILTDDQGWSDVGFHESDVKTPHLDRLAAGGVRLHQHYVYPTCSPTRVALLSGRFPSRFGVLAPLGATTQMQPSDANLPQRLGQLGYSTHISGKWHIGETPPHRPLNYGFDTSYGYLRGQIDPYTHRYKFGNHVTWHRNDQFVEEDGHVTRLITDEAIRVIEESGEEPFFLYVAHHSPHAPLNEPPQWIEPYEDEIEDIARRHFAAAITHVDHEVGRLVEALERAGKRENTLIVYSSDNGAQRNWNAPRDQYNGRYASLATLGNNQPWRGWKGDLYEGGIRVPAFVNWPGVVPEGVVLDVPLHIVDWAPTLITLAGGEVDSAWNLEGMNVWSYLVGQASGGQLSRTLYWKTPRETAVRQGNWKLIHNRGDDEHQLFDLREDPYEKHDLGDQQPEQLAKLKVLMNELAQADR